MSYDSCSPTMFRDPLGFFSVFFRVKGRPRSVLIRQYSVHLVLVPLFGYLLLDGILQRGDTHNAFAGSNELCYTLYKNIVSDLFFVSTCAFAVLASCLSRATFPWHECRSIREIIRPVAFRIVNRNLESLRTCSIHRHMFKS